ncbi:MAG: response regulator [Synechococcales bacterium]|nr:response regulator [Synechococcales bacterium]
MTASPENRELHILLVEDDEVDVMNVKRALRKYGINHPIYVAGDGQQALALLRQENPDDEPIFPKERRIIFLDLNMPGMGGIEFLKELRADPKLCRTPVVVMTTSDADEDLVRAYDLNVAGYILKSVPFSDFAEAMAVVDQYWNVNEIP